MIDGRIDTRGTVKSLQASHVLDRIAQEEKSTIAEDEAVEPEVVPDEKIAASTATLAKKPKKFIEEEARATGRVKWSMYNKYMHASAYWAWVLIITLILLSQGLGIVEKVSL